MTDWYNASYDFVDGFITPVITLTSWQPTLEKWPHITWKN